jgi:hypothetical protein
MRHLMDRSVRLAGAVAGLTTFLACGDDLVTPDEGAPRSITIVQGATQTGTAGQPLPVALVVEVKDDVGRPVAQQQLTIALEDGGSINPAQPVTNNQGRATFTWTLGPAAGAQQLSVATATSGPSVTFQGTAAPATANVAAPVGGNGQTGQTGKPLPDSLVLRVTDQFGNPVSGAAVTWTTDYGTVSPTTGVTNAAGLARTRWTLGIISGTQTVNGTVAGVTDPATFSATATPGPTPVLIIDRQPSTSAESGKELDRQPRVRLQDGEGNNLPTSGVVVTASLAGGPGSLGGTTTATTAGNGRAEFDDLSITAPAGKYAITFAASGYSSVISDSITLENRPVSPSRSTLTSDSTVIHAGNSTVLTARVVDADSNPLPGITVTFSVTGSGHTLQQPGLPTNADGVVTGSLAATSSGARTVTARAGNVQLNANAVIQVDPGPPAASTTDAQVPDGNILSFTNILIRAADAFGNAHTTGGFGPQFQVAVTGSANSSPAVTDNGNGTYSASFFKLLPGADTVRITLNGVPIKGSPYVSD